MHSSRTITVDAKQKSASIENLLNYSWNSWIMRHEDYSQLFFCHLDILWYWRTEHGSLCVSNLWENSEVVYFLKKLLMSDWIFKDISCKRYFKSSSGTKLSKLGQIYNIYLYWPISQNNTAIFRRGNFEQIDIFVKLQYTFCLWNISRFYASTNTVWKIIHQEFPWIGEGKKL